MSSPAAHITDPKGGLGPALFPKTNAVQEWIAGESGKGLLDFKLCVNVTASTTAESLSCGVLELLTAPAISGVALD